MGEEEITVEQVPVIKREKDKVCIVGCSSSKDLAPFGDPSFEFWGVNNLFLHMADKPWSKWFEIHSIAKDGGKFVRRDLVKDHTFIWSKEFRGQKVDDYIAGLGQLKCPVIMQAQWPEIPTSAGYPIDEMVKMFGNYFTNTVSYEIALAIAMGYQEIALYGIDMAVGSEYAHQRPSCEYFIGIALGRGIKITIPPEADLCKTRFMYAFQDKEAEHWEKKVRSMLQSVRKQKQEAEQNIYHWNKKLEQSIGAELALVESDKIWGVYK